MKKSFKEYVAEFVKSNHQSGSGKKYPEGASCLKDWKTLRDYILLRKKTLENKDDEKYITSINPYWFYPISYSKRHIDMTVRHKVEIMSEDIFLLYEQVQEKTKTKFEKKHWNLEKLNQVSKLTKTKRLKFVDSIIDGPIQSDNEAELLKL